MATSLRPNPFYDALADEHRRWLSTFDPQYLTNWEKTLVGDEEAALAEAGVRRLLQSHGARVKPNEHLTGAEQRPDFYCHSKGSGFEVEVTHISIEKATTKTGLAHPPTPGFGGFSLLNDAISKACKGKARQCGGADCPTLLAVATFHCLASMICLQKHFVGMLLTGETMGALDIDLQTGRSVGGVYRRTELRSAAFVRPDESQDVAFALSSISALLLCGLGAESQDDQGVRSPRVIGVLHPNAARPFNPGVLPHVKFGQVVIDRASRQLRVEWG